MNKGQTARVLEQQSTEPAKNLEEAPCPMAADGTVPGSVGRSCGSIVAGINCNNYNMI